MTERIGFVGLGNMGQPMARNLLHAGYFLNLYDSEEQRVLLLLSQGASWSRRLRDVGGPGSIVVTMVPTDNALREIALGEGHLMESLCPGGIHLSLSTVSPEVSQELATRYAERGGTFLAGTVLGRPDVAARAELAIYLSGCTDAKARVLPLVRVLGKNVYDLGEDVASANVVKLAANYLILAALTAMGEASAFVERHGVSRSLFLDSMAKSPLFGGAVYEGYGKMIGGQDYFDNNFPVTMGLKDASLILEAASRIGLEMPVALLSLQHLLDAYNDGRSAESWAVLAEYATPKPPTLEMTRKNV